MVSRHFDNTTPDSIAYNLHLGRVEVEALLPAGDWLWPAIWMLPVKSTYGDWPASGEIDIAESRGNNHTYPLGGNNIASGTLHWGPDADDDAWYHTFEKKTALHTTFSAKYHTFGEFLTQCSPKRLSYRSRFLTHCRS